MIKRFINLIFNLFLKIIFNLFIKGKICIHPTFGFGSGIADGSGRHAGCDYGHGNLSGSTSDKGDGASDGHGSYFHGGRPYGNGSGNTSAPGHINCYCSENDGHG